MTNSSEQTTLMQVFPMQINEPMTITGGFQVMLPWFAPSVLGATGHAVDDSEDAMIAVCYEWPVPWVRTVEPFSSQQREWLHVRRFRTDLRLGTGLLPFASITPNEKDPPDMFAVTDAGRIGIECTTLSLGGERRGAHALFEELRKQILLNADAFDHLAGHVVHIWFADKDALLTRPHARNDKAAMDELLRALALYRPDVSEMTRHREVPPDQFSMKDVFKPSVTNAGASFYCTPLIGAAPGTAMFSILGFELSLAFTTVHRIKDEWKRLQDKIKEKDRPGNDLLLISAGAPNQHGTLHSSEDILVEHMLKNIPEIASLEHLSNIVVHSWSTGRTFQLWPECQQLFGPLCMWASPEHHNIVNVKQSGMTARSDQTDFTREGDH